MIDDKPMTWTNRAKPSCGSAARAGSWLRVASTIAAAQLYFVDGDGPTGRYDRDWTTLVLWWPVIVPAARDRLK
jgi:hypothetical protein